jgi:hypothetical protein
MKRHLTVLLFVLLSTALLIGCETSKELGEEGFSSPKSAQLESAIKSNSTAQNEKTSGLELKEKFLNSKEGHAFQVVSWKFTKAFLSGDVSTMKIYLVDPQDNDYYNNTEHIFNDVEFLILKLDPKDIKADMVIAEYEFGLKDQDTLQYLYLKMRKVNNEWKVQYYGLEM